MAAASSLYGSGVLAVTGASDPYFAAAFPAFSLYAVEQSGHVLAFRHYMAYDATLGRAYDVTKDARSLGILVATGPDAIRYGEALAEAANPEVQPGRSVVASADSGWLGALVPDPSSSGKLGIWTASFDTWSRAGGVLESWTVTFGGGGVPTRAEWSVVATGLGPLVPDDESGWLAAGDHVVDAWTSTSATVAADRSGAPMLTPPQFDAQTFSVVDAVSDWDGSVWRLLFPAGDLVNATPDDLARGEALLHGASDAYNLSVASAPGCSSLANPNASWGYASPDLDCNREVVFQLGNGVCLACSPQGTEARIVVASNEVGDRARHAYASASDPATVAARIVAAHEHYHNLQWGASRFVEKGAPVDESQAVLAQTLYDPADSYLPGSGVYAHDSPTFAQNPSVGFCNDQYGAWILWGLMYAEVGHAGLRAFLAALPQGDTGGCDPATVERAFDAALTPTGTTSLDFLATYAQDLYEHQVSWSGRNWDAPGYVRAPLEHAAGVGNATWTLPALAATYLSLPLDAGHQVACGVGDGGWTAVLLVNQTGLVTPTRVACGGASASYSPAGASEVVLALVHAGAASGSDWVRVA
ncbi:MAG: hypothetical protein QOE90_864 [Thermoplasmata archaeon]|nr:hypothetical protein [Thermoplasmata archaeon]